MLISDYTIMWRLGYPETRNFRRKLRGNERFTQFWGNKGLVTPVACEKKISTHAVACETLAPLGACRATP